MTATALSPTRPAWLAARLLATLMLAGAAMLSFAQDESDPPGRVGRITHADGAVSFAEAGTSGWTNAQPNRPLTRGDRLWVDRSARGEVHVGSTALRLGGQTHVEIMALDDQSTQLNLTQGSLSVRIREMAPGERFEVGTPNLALALSQPGEYRIDVDPNGDATRVAVHSGAGVVYGENRESLSLAPQQQMSFSGRGLAQAAPHARLSRDGFDQWVAARDQAEEQSVAARYVSREIIGYQQLDAYGDWRNEPGYGPVWIPRATVADWAPYRYGHWSWISPWGWTWIDDAPWGFAPFHYGRWAQVGPRWAWVPGPRAHRPVYAPALVAFVGGNSGGVNWSISLNSGPGVAWFPLGPGDAWRPGYRASRHYMERVNRAAVIHAGGNSLYANQRRPGAITAASTEDFGRGRNGRGFQRMNDAELARARVVEPPPTPGRGRFGDRERPQPARALPPAAVLAQPAPLARAVAPARAEERGDARRDDRRDDRRDNRQAGPQRDPREEQAQRQQQERARAEQGRRDTAQREQAQRDNAQRQQSERAQHERAQEHARERAQRQQQVRVERAPPMAAPPAPAAAATQRAPRPEGRRPEARPGNDGPGARPERERGQGRRERD